MSPANSVHFLESSLYLTATSQIVVYSIKYSYAHTWTPPKNHPVGEGGWGWGGK